mgnify:CR=1 FL=1
MDSENIRKYINILNETVRASTEESVVDEKWGKPTEVPKAERGKYKGWTLAELRKAYNALKARGPHKKGSADFGRMRELAFAIRAKTGWGKVSEKSGCPTKS